MIHAGENLVEGVPVLVERKRIRRINLRIAADGTVKLSVPLCWATLHEGERFLASKWQWALKARAEALARNLMPKEPITPEERAWLEATLAELHDCWLPRLNEGAVTWRLRRMRTVWGSCHWRDRHIVYNLELARKPLELVEYVVVHELTHFRAHGHGPLFHELMDARLPGWQALRRRLNGR